MIRKSKPAVLHKECFTFWFLDFFLSDQKNQNQLFYTRSASLFGFLISSCLNTHPCLWMIRKSKPAVLHKECFTFWFLDFFLSEHTPLLVDDQKIKTSCFTQGVLHFLVS